VMQTERSCAWWCPENLVGVVALCHVLPRCTAWGWSILQWKYYELISRDSWTTHLAASRILLLVRNVALAHIFYYWQLLPWEWIHCVSCHACQKIPVQELWIIICRWREILKNFLFFSTLLLSELVTTTEGTLLDIIVSILRMAWQLLWQYYQLSASGLHAQCINFHISSLLYAPILEDCPSCHLPMIPSPFRTNVATET
jgi:hypothetical protein